VSDAFDADGRNKALCESFCGGDDAGLIHNSVLSAAMDGSRNEATRIGLLESDRRETMGVLGIIGSGSGVSTVLVGDATVVGLGKVGWAILLVISQIDRD
jgi:hypothetical protein